MAIDLTDDMDKVWLSTMGFAHSDAIIFLGPIERPEVVQDFRLGEDQLMITSLLQDLWRPHQSLAPWVEFTQAGTHGLLRVDEGGQGNFSAGLTMTLEAFYRHNPHITNLSADDLRLLGGFDV